ncbi:MAG TPA: Imm52 family immunity protein [Chitinophagaceae bacterium]|nr:Imm52 family immunity protein [Chitinophagaceae bacterium]
MIESYYIGAYWGSRTEPLAQVKNKILQTLQRLAEIDEQFLNWYEEANSREKALGKKVSIDADSVERLCLEMVRKGELDEKGFAEMGFLFGIWSGHLDDESSNISFNVGKAFTSQHLSNSCVITIPFEGAARERLLQIDKAKKIIALLVEIWNPDYAVLTSHQLRDKLNVANKVGWITYRQSIKNTPMVNNRVSYEKLNNGYLFTTAFSIDKDTDSSINELLKLKSYLIS